MTIVAAILFVFSFFCQSVGVVLLLRGRRASVRLGKSPNRHTFDGGNPAGERLVKGAFQDVVDHLLSIQTGQLPAIWLIIGGLVTGTAGNFFALSWG